MTATDTPLPTRVTTSVARSHRVVVEMSRGQLAALVALVGNTSYDERVRVLRDGNPEHDARLMAQSVGDWYHRVTEER